jgi:hypothetical protein
VRGDFNGDGAWSKDEFAQLLAKRFPLRTGDRQFSTTSGERGRVQAELPFGEYRIVAEPPRGFATIEQTLHLQAGGVFDYIYVEKLAAPAPTRHILTVKAQSSDEELAGRAQPLDSAVVVITPQRGGERQVGRTHSNGKHSFSVKPGAHQVEVKLNGYEPQTTLVNVQDQTELALTLRKVIRQASSPGAPERAGFRNRFQRPSLGQGASADGRRSPHLASGRRLCQHSADRRQRRRWIQD